MEKTKLMLDLYFEIRDISICVECHNKGSDITFI